MSHSHAHPHMADPGGKISQRMTIALVITLLFVVVEAAAGIMANSLALLTDAAHNVTDVIALALSVFAIRLSAQPASAGRTFGYHRAGIMVALINSSGLIIVAIGILIEAVRRLTNPGLAVDGGILTITAAIAFAVNLGTALLIRKGSENDLNVRSAFVHLAADAVSTLGAVIAGIVIMFTGWQALDPIVSIGIAGLIAWNAWEIIRDSGSILMENTPRDLDLSQLVSDVSKVDGVRSLHDLHVWSLTEQMRALSAHVVVDDMPVSQGASIQQNINEVLAHKYQIAHSVLQLECIGCQPDGLFCAIEPHHHQHAHGEPA